MSARNAMLEKIRTRIGGGDDEEKRRAVVADRLGSVPKGIIPKRGQLNARKRLELFCERAETFHATTQQVMSYDEIPQAVSEYLRQKNLPQAIKTGSDERLGEIDWSNTPNLDRNVGATSGDDPVGLSHATNGVAETGTLLLASGPENPTTLNFLPENHIVVIKAGDIEGDYESALGKIRKSYGKGRMPRIVNMITGPSRSADIEQKLLLGAHGPRTLHIIVVDD